MNNLSLTDHRIQLLLSTILDTTLTIQRTYFGIISKCKPWSDFIDLTSYNLPLNAESKLDMMVVGRRYEQNFQAYMNNYILLLLPFCLIWSISNWYFLTALLFSFTSYCTTSCAFKLYSNGKVIKINDYLVGDNERYALSGVFSYFWFWMFGCIITSVVLVFTLCMIVGVHVIMRSSLPSSTRGLNVNVNVDSTPTTTSTLTKSADTAVKIASRLEDGTIYENHGHSEEEEGGFIGSNVNGNQALRARNVSGSGASSSNSSNSNNDGMRDVEGFGGNSGGRKKE